jgi:hypothetical protein
MNRIRILSELPNKLRRRASLPDSDFPYRAFSPELHCLSACAADQCSAYQWGIDRINIWQTLLSNSNFENATGFIEAVKSIADTLAQNQRFLSPCAQFVIVLS